MSIALNVSNSLQPLSVKLAADLKNSSENPFVKQWVVTQTEGMNSWLKQKIASENGIAANINFCKPNDIVSEIYRKCLSSGKQVMNTENIRWCLYAILDHADFKTSFPEIAGYYQQNDIKRIALADELSDLFDQYQIYRHDFIQQWNKDWINGIEATDWQVWLWQNVKSQLSAQYQDRVEMAEVILAGLSNLDTQEAVKGKIPQLHLFGIAVITPYYLQIFHAMSQFMDIHLYLINPSPDHLWMDDKSEKQINRLLQKRGIKRVEEDHILQGNDLLLNWGSIIKESFSLLMNNDEFINLYDTSFAIPIDNPNSLLKKIQQDIFQNSKTSERLPISESDIADGSITINGAFTPVREVEILYNYLVQLIDQRKEILSPKDIVVLVSDIELYAPFIHAVFTNSPYKFPYNIADECYSAGNNMFTAIQEILSLDSNSFKAEAVLKLLESPYIKDRFKIKEEETLRSAIKQAGIIFSIDGRTEDDTRYISWNYGLKKIMYGICISGEPDINDGFDNFVPLDSAEGVDTLDRVRLVYFIKILQKKLEERHTDRTISDWAIYLQDLVEDMIFQAGEKDDEDYTNFIRFTENMALLEQGSSLLISYEVFRHSFLQRLNLERKSSSFAKGGITFCTLVPMRSIPFKVVAMLGMDFDKFPRKETPLSFSLLQNWKPGDRNVKNNDKHLFLETLISAQQYFYVSYIAISAKDGTALPPSSLVDELIDYIARGLRKDTDEFRKAWITIHPLHSFSHKYSTQGGLISYLNETRYLTNIVIPVNPIVEQTFSFEQVEIDQIARFLQNPPRLYLVKQFHVYYNEDDLLLQDHELFEFDQLTQWGVQDDIMLLDETEIAAYYEKKKQTGEIPLHNMGEATIRDVVDAVAGLRDRFNQVRDNQVQRIVDINFQIDGSQIIGKIGAVFGDRYISICNSSQRLKYLILAYTKYLALIAQGEKLEFVFIAKKLDIAQIIPAGTITQTIALNTLSRYLTFYKNGHSSYFNFWPALGQSNLEMILGTYDNFWADYEDARDNERDFTFDNEYLDKAVENGFFSEAAFPSIQQNVEEIFEPLQALLPRVFEKIKN